MANNRIHLVCTICKDAGVEDHALLIAKYYPNTGWYRKLNGLDARLDTFFTRHEHPERTSMWGLHIQPVREVDEE